MNRANGGGGPNGTDGESSPRSNADGVASPSVESDGTNGREAVIEVEGVTVELGGIRALDGVDLTVDRSRFVGLIGPNGAGKTTLLRAINAAIEPSVGRVTVEGRRIHRLSSRAASRLVATVPQDTTLAFDFDVRQVVEMGRTPHVGRFGGWGTEDAAAVDRAMARTGVADLSDRPITAVSGGERQRVLLARALAQDAAVLLLDEPTASLDVNHQVRTLELVRNLVADGRTVVAAIHDLNLAARYCDELVLLGEGRALAAGPPAAVLTEETVQRAFDVEAVVSDHPVTGTTHVTALPDEGDAEGRIHVVGGGSSGARHLHGLAAAGYEVSTGALNEGDTDAAAARYLGVDCVTVPPYAPVDAAARDAVEARVRAADVTLVADVEVGEGNLPNLEAARTADSLVVVEDQPFDERNHADEAGECAYAALRERGRVVGPREALSAVRDAFDGTPGDDLPPETGDGSAEGDGTVRSQTEGPATLWDHVGYTGSPER